MTLNKLKTKSYLLTSQNFRRRVYKSKSMYGPNENSIDNPRIKFLHENDGECPIYFTRIQFPFKLSFAMTITKAQVQAFHQKVAVYLQHDVFTHGLLYMLHIEMHKSAKPFNLFKSFSKSFKYSM
ncbi:hypothetical protein C6P40_000740 [Pichia californica]|uniref:Uncharacterized protein n=1 Tax=Pichia californica TaxID=460514 RepID=A0A9P6WKH5_9ASCO|nr:hypothetical protein C6P42_000712 [[Candida] californica]KAG0688631.1 hypothetical protein C6P40_000740 [[Candida] californica]